MPERFGHLTPAAPAAHTGQAATAETSAAVPVAGLAIEIAARAQSGNTRFEIRLDPPELGRIDVRLDVDQRGHVTSRLVVEKSETLDLLKRDAPELERALQQAGLKTSDSGLQFTLRDQAFAGRDDRSDLEMARVVVPDAELPPVETVRSGYGRWLRIDGGLDIRV
jgi:chemotaxis protein MotD